MSAANNGGPAYPRSAAWSNPGATSVSSSQEGMTLRDYFAAHAPITTKDAMLACGVAAGSVGMMPRAERIAVMTALAEMRADYADAMLAERAK